jgi:hypothetical protein
MEGNEIQRCQSSVKIARNGKGEASYEIKAYADTIEEAIELAVSADKKVEAKVRR